MAEIHAKTWLKRYFDDNNFPEWTKSNVGITVPLHFPEKEISEQEEDSLTLCILCDEFFSLPSNSQKLLKHLAESHRFIIGDVNLIADLSAYISYWKNKFKEKSLNDYTVSMKCSVSNEKECSQETFIFLSDANPEDKELRINLQMTRLTRVLEIQEFERQNKAFKRSCLFCRSEFTNIKEHFDHMAFAHNFSVGQPDNLVFISDLLNLLEEKLESLTCMFCENVFKSREVLKEHMRKKSHKKINPKNSIYDKFYLVNYLEFGKSWIEIIKESNDCIENDDELPFGFDSEEDTDTEWSDWKGELGKAVCLFCNANYGQISDLIYHMKSIHNFDFTEIRDKQQLNFYEQVKLINYIRRKIHLNTCFSCTETFNENEELMEHMRKLNHFVLPEEREEWDQSQYYFPTYENDNFLHGLEENDFENDTPSIVIPEDCPLVDSILVHDEFRETLLSKNQRKK